MKLFSNCCDCIICSQNGHCLAGHGDDDFSIASKDVLIDKLKNDKLSHRDINIIKGTLLLEYNYNYDLDTRNENVTCNKDNKVGTAFANKYSNKCIGIKERL